MRWLIIKCLLLATIALTSGTRPKRDLQRLSNLFTSFLRRPVHLATPSYLSNEPEYKFYRVPELGNQIFKITKLNTRTGIASSKIDIGAVNNISKETIIAVPGNSYESNFNMKVPFHPVYSYKQLQNNVPVMVYTAQDNPDIGKDKVKITVPTCIKKRINDVISLTAKPNVAETIRAIFPIQSYPSLYFKYPYYKRNVETNLSQPLPVQLNQNNTFLSSIPTPHEKGFVSNQSFDLSGTTGLIPPLYIPHKITTKWNEKGDLATNTDGIFEHKVGDIEINPENMVPSYVYRQSSPEPYSTIKSTDNIDTGAHFKNLASNNYVYVPPKLQYQIAIPNFKRNKKSQINLRQPMRLTTAADMGSGVRSETEKNADTTPNINGSGIFKNNPIVVSPSPIFSYEQKNVDVTRLSNTGNHDGVSVDLNNGTESSNRGDIPDWAMVNK